MKQSNKTKRICLISSVPSTLWTFYRGLIMQLNKEYDEVALVSSDLPELHWFKKELGVTVFAAQIARRIAPLQDLISIFKLCYFLRRKKFDIVHAHTPKGGLIGMISSFLAGIPNRVYTVHGLPLETAKGLKWFLLWLAEWLACKLATTVLAVSPSLRQRIIEEELCFHSKLQVLGNGSACGIDLSKFSPSERLTAAGRKIRANSNIPDDTIVIGFVGRVTPDKGVDLLVGAFERLQQCAPKSYLLLVGEFETVRETLNEKTIQSIKSNEQILYNDEFVTDVLPFYAAMDIVVLPSRREGFGITLIEAAALELPTIATKVTGCVDAVVDNHTGLLVEVDNEMQLAHAMSKLVNDAELRKKLGQQGCEGVRKRFDSRQLISKHIELYTELLEQHTKEQ